MKKIKCTILILIFVIMPQSTAFAKWVKSDKLNNYLWIDENTNTITVNNYFWAKDGDVEKLYYAGEYGFIYINKAIDNDFKANEKGEIVHDGQVVIRYIQSDVINATGKELVDKKEEKVKSLDEMKSVEDSTNIIYAQKGESSGRLLKNYIIDSQNVEIINEKTINGTKKNNVINFKTSGSFISINTKKYNKIIIKAERDNSNKNIDYELRLVVNGVEEDNLSFEDDENTVEQEFTFKQNDEVDLVMYSNDTSKWSSKGMYITQGRMSKYKEEDDE